MVDGASLGRRLSRGAPLGRPLSSSSVLPRPRHAGATPWQALCTAVASRTLGCAAGPSYFRTTSVQKDLKEVNESMSMTHSREGTFAGSLKHPCQNLHSRGTAQSSNEVDRCKMSTPNRCNAGSSKTRHLLELTDPCIGHYAFFSSLNTSSNSEYGLNTDCSSCQRTKVSMEGWDAHCSGAILLKSGGVGGNSFCQMAEAKEGGFEGYGPALA